MGLFNRQQTEPVVKAAAASGNTGRTQVDSYVTYFQGPQRQRYMAVPTVSRARFNRRHYWLHSVNYV